MTHSINLKVSGLHAFIGTYSKKTGEKILTAAVFNPKKWRTRYGALSKYYSFRSFKEIREHINGILKREQAKADERMLRNVERKNARVGIIDSYAIGDILNTSWGYDQTNVEFVQVVRKTKKTLVVRAIAGNLTDGTGNSMAGYTAPIKDKFIGPESVISIQPWGASGEHSLVGPYTYNYKGREEKIQTYKRDGARFYKTTADKKHYVSWYA